MTSHFLLLLVLTFAIYSAAQVSISDPSTSFCATGATSGAFLIYTPGTGICGSGDGNREVMLRSNLIEVGIHSVGSYGTTRRAPTGYVGDNARLGFIADHGEDGWDVPASGSPPYSGDYFVPGSPVEGWVIEWQQGSSFTRRVNKGLISTNSARIPMPPAHIIITSEGTQQSALWVGRSGNMQVTKVTQFDENNLYFTTSVTLKNLGGNTMTNVFYMRTVDPDQEQPFTGVFSTDNYVKWQRTRSGDAVVRANGVGDLRNECFVGAAGQTFTELFCGLGTINSNCRANHFGFNNNDVRAAWNDDAWEGFSDVNRRRADEAINLMFLYDSITPGATVQFNYAYVLKEVDLVAAMNGLQYVKITQPTDIVSGADVSIVAEIDPIAFEIDIATGIAANPVVEVIFQMFASREDDPAPSWIEVSRFVGVENRTTYSSFGLDSREYLDSIGQLKAIFSMTNGEIYENSIGVEIFEGIDMCFDLDNDGISDGSTSATSSICQLKMGSDNPLSLVPCNEVEALNLPSIREVSFFRNIAVGGEVFEQGISAPIGPPGAPIYRQEVVAVDDLFAFSRVTITAKTTLLSGSVVSASVSCQVLEQNIAPTSIRMQPAGTITEVVSENAGTNWITVGFLSTVDENEFDEHTYTIVNNNGNRFRISPSGSNLEHSPDLDFESFSSLEESTTTFPVTVTSDDGNDDDCCRSQTFDLVIYNVNEKPSLISTTGVSVGSTTPAVFDLPENFQWREDRGAVPIHTFVISDPDIGQAHTCQLIGSALFAVDLDTCVFRLLGNLNFESQQSHTLTLIVQDNGRPIATEGFQIIINVIDVNEPPNAFNLFLDPTLVGAIRNTGASVSILETPTSGPSIGTPLDSTIGNLRARDPECESAVANEWFDAGSCGSEELRLEIITNTGGHFGIRNGNELYVASAIDFEALGNDGRMTMTARVFDSAGLFRTQIFTFFILDVDEPPSATNLNCFLNEGTRTGQIAGNTAAGSGPICQVDATASGDEELAYSIVELDTPFSIQDCSGIIFVDELLDFEGMPQVYNFQVRIDGSGSANLVVQVSIVILDVNEPPVFDNSLIEFDVAEAVAAGSVVLADLTSQVTDEDADETTTFSLSGENLDFFSIDTATGAITLLRAVNFESLETFNLQVLVSDEGGLFARASIIVTILDSPEDPTFPTYSGTWADVFETGATGGAENDDLVGGLIIASDEDANSSITYSIVGGNTGGAYQIRTSTEFGIEVGQLSVADAAALDFENASIRTYALVIRATDNSGRFAEVTLSVETLNSNEAPILADQVFSVSEDAAQGSVVGLSLEQLSSDPENDILSFDKVDGDTGIFTAFAVDPISGNITIAATRLNFEVVAQYVYTIAVFDGKGGRIESSVTINVVDVLEPPQFKSAPSGSISENAGADAFDSFSQNSDQLVRIVVEDEDIGDSVGLLITSTDPESVGLFALELVDPSDPNQYYLKASRSLNFEEVSAYTINLEATDDALLSTSASVAVNVINVNDAPTFPVGSRACFIDVTANPDTQACTITAIDEDSSASANGQLDYSMVYQSCQLSADVLGGVTGGGPSCDGAPYMTLNSIDATSGIMRIANVPNLRFPNVVSDPPNNFENALLTYEVTVSDRGTPPMVATAIYTLAVRPTNNLPSCGSIPTFEIAENLPAGTSVGILTGPTLIRDSEKDALGLTITAGNSGGFFAISADGTSLVTAASMINYEINPDFTLNIRVSELVSVRRNTVDCAVTVNIVDVNEPTTFNDLTVFADENIAPGPLMAGGFAVAAVAATDVDARDQGGTYAFVGTLPSPSPIDIVSATGVLQLREGMTLDFEAVNAALQPLNSYIYTVRWTSPSTWGAAGNEFKEVVLTLRVVDISESPLIAVGGGSTIFNINEGIPGSLGFLEATDPDFPRMIPCGDNCGLRYSLVSTDGGPFAIDRNTGELRATSDVTTPGESPTDFEAKGVYSLIARVQDLNGNGAFDSKPVRVWINNVNDCRVSAVWDSTLKTSLFKTQGLEVVFIYGSNLIPTSARLAEAGLADSDIVISVVFKDSSPTPKSYTPTGCVLRRAVGTVDERIECLTVEGTGGPFAAEVTITVPYPANAGGFGSGGTKVCTTPLNFAAVMNYRSPVIDSIAIAADFSTAGGEVATFDGENFGPSSTAVFGSYRNGVNSYTTAQCTIVIPHLRVTCRTVPGVGAGHQWRIQVAGLFSTTFAQPTSYGRPAVAAVALERGAVQVNNNAMDTSGADVIFLTGSNFGSGLSTVSVQYGNVFQFANNLAFTATGCETFTVTTQEWPLGCSGHTCMKCSSVAGVGGDLSYRVSVGGQTGDSSVVTTSYQNPIITGISGPGFRRASSEGGQVIDVAGSQFGPSQPDGIYSYIEVTYGPDFIYTATDCAIITAHRFVRCFTGPGTGFNHTWKISISEVDSTPLDTAMSYAPPIVAFYAGPGSVEDNAVGSGNTRGNQIVTVFGRNFGTVVEKITSVTYSREGENARVFNVTDSCVITNAHTELSCTTVAGAGSEMLWNVTVDGQESESPTTSYAAPILTALTGPGVVGAVNFGGQVVTIAGDFFGPSRTDSIADGFASDFIDPGGVTYGPTGSEYVARDCEVVDQSTITCLTAPGVGANLFWSVFIAGQQSGSDTSIVSSYAPPEISRITPALYVTDGLIQIAIEGTNLGVVDVPVVSFGAVTLAQSQVSVFRGIDRVFFTLPEKTTLGTGFQHLVTLEVGGQRSNSVMFTYKPPVISSVHSVTDPVDPLRVTVVILGESFSTVPNVSLRKLNNEVVELFCFLQSHSEIQCYTNIFIGFISVDVDGQVSNEMRFESGDPVVVYTQLESDTDERHTEGGVVLEILCQYCGLVASALEVRVGSDVMRSCVIDEARYRQASSSDGIILFGALKAKIDSKFPVILFNEGEYVQQIFCTLPEGQDLRQSVTVTRNNSKTSLGCLTVRCVSCTTAPCFDYLPPTVATVSELFDTTRGGKVITVTGRSFGVDMEVAYGDYKLALTTRGHSELVGIVPPGVDFDMPLFVNVGSQSSTEDFKFSYLRPTFTAASIVTLSSKTLGGTGSIAGENFGNAGITSFAGPVLTIGGIVLNITNYDHRLIEFDIPPGQGFNLPITLNVSDQFNILGETFSYDEPEMSTSTLTNPQADTVGGRVSGETITLIGDNFGLRSGSWSIVLAGDSGVTGARRLDDGDDSVSIDLVVTDADIVAWEHERVEFYAPEGQGVNKALVMTVGGQVLKPPSFGGIFCGTRLSAVAACFSYNPPVISGLVDIFELGTTGGYPLSIEGTSFGIAGATVTIGDPLYNSTHPINQQRMSSTNCPVVSQGHKLVVCTVPAGYGGELEVRLTVEGITATSPIFFGYAIPVITFIIGNQGGDAAGGEQIKVYGENFGPRRTAVNLTIGNETCTDAYWTNDDPITNFEPYIMCLSSAKTTVDRKDVAIDVAFSSSEVFERWSVECKVGYYGRTGEECAQCGNPEITGYVCEDDALEQPISAASWWNIEQVVPSEFCHEEMNEGTRPTCPSMWPCMPNFACLGNNTCDFNYDGDSVRCARCNEGFFKLGGLCQECPDNPWIIIGGIILALLTAIYVFKKLEKKQVNLGIATIGVDYFQVLAIFSTSNVEWPSELQNLYNVLSAFNLNIDLAAPECWQGSDFTYDQKWFVVEATPVTLLAFASILYAFKYCWKRMKGRKARLHSHAPKLFGTTVTIFYYTYLYVTTKTLSVFNCQATLPDDGFKYMTEVGTEDGRCYVKGGMQQMLEPYAYTTFFLYTVGFPLLCGVLLYTNRMTCFLDQILKADHRNEEELKAAGVYQFRKMWHRLYHYYKPQYFYWILIVLFRKFMIAFTALVFRDNTLFMLSMTLLVMIVSYAIQVKYQPYMSTAEFDKVVEDNSAMIDEIVSAKLMHLKKHKQATSRTRVAKLGRSSFMDIQIRSPSISFLHNYNTVESSLLFSAIIVNLSGIMFESGQLTGFYERGLTYFVIMLVVSTLIYFVWVLSTELWIAFYPLQPFLFMSFCDLGSKNDEDDGDEKERDSDLVFDVNPGMAGIGDTGLSSEKMEYLEAELNKMWGSVSEKDKMIKLMQDEIRALKQQGSSSKFQSLGKNVLKMGKEKKVFGTSAAELSAAARAALLSHPQAANYETAGNNSSEEGVDLSGVSVGVKDSGYGRGSGNGNRGCNGAIDGVSGEGSFSDNNPMHRGRRGE